MSPGLSARSSPCVLMTALAVAVGCSGSRTDGLEKQRDLSSADGGQDDGGQDDGGQDDGGQDDGSTQTCVDADEDGFGPGCERGDDCDDQRADLGPDDCPGLCTPTAGDADCDGIDDDCDGRVDEDYIERESRCERDGCQRVGRITCAQGREVDSCPLQAGGAASDTTCDGLDDDCDGQVDEDFAGVRRECGVGACAAAAADVCSDGRMQSACAPANASGPDASCDGVDDDCDGVSDEDFAPPAQSCGVGACLRSGNLRCEGGQDRNDCVAGAPAPRDASCDGVDDDCDGLVDEDYAPTVTRCGAGACTASGSLRCIDGRMVDTCDEGRAGGADLTCDGIDSDCDGTPDDDYRPRALSCGVGACRVTMQSRCQSGSEQLCAPGSATGSDDDCDGVDDDCDGSTDEAFVAVPLSCGVGACLRQGTRSCSAGNVVDNCRPGPAASGDATCDGSDDDCNGEVDEDYRVSISCGAGACRRTGTQTCRAGQTVDACTPGARPAAEDSACNGIDDDCDGQIDEDYRPRAIQCGVGACLRQGMTTCLGGQEGNMCSAGPAAANDMSCNGVDDDCNGAVDEDYQVTPGPSCGLGVCLRQGQVLCEGGSTVSDCRVGPRALERDTLCNGLDDDCDGSADEEYASLATSCGVGACAARGVTRCVGGVVADSCAPGVPAANDASCNGLDDDCDGRVDEDCRYTITTRVLPAGAGSVSCGAQGCSVEPGGARTLTATAATDYVFDEWSDCNTSTTNPLLRSNVRAPQTCTANFARTSTTTVLNVARPDSLVLPGGYTRTVRLGTATTFTAVEFIDYQGTLWGFREWLCPTLGQTFYPQMSITVTPTPSAHACAAYYSEAPF